MCRARAEEESGREADAVLPLRGAEADGGFGAPSLAARLDWQAVLIQHSYKSFVLPRDRLDSLAGLAAEVSAARGDDEYLHGLFRFDLPADLLWARHGTLDDARPPHLQARRRRERAAAELHARLARPPHRVPAAVAALLHRHHARQPR